MDVCVYSKSFKLLLFFYFIILHYNKSELKSKIQE